MLSTGKFFRKADKLCKQMGAEILVYFHFILSLVISACWTEPQALNGHLTNIQEISDL